METSTGVSVLLASIRSAGHENNERARISSSSFFLLTSAYDSLISDIIFQTKLRLSMTGALRLWQ